MTCHKFFIERRVNPWVSKIGKKANKKIVKEENLINKANAQKIAKTGVVQSKEDRDRLLRASSLSIADFFKDIGVDEKTGLNDETVEANREKYGANTVTKIKVMVFFIDFSKHLLLLFH